MKMFFTSILLMLTFFCIGGDCNVEFVNFTGDSINVQQGNNEYVVISDTVLILDDDNAIDFTNNSLNSVSFSVETCTGYTENVTILSTESYTISQSNLPVELLYWDVEQENQSNLLKWATASEHDNDFFIIEKSNNGIEWVDIAKVNGSGTTVLGSEYSYLDKNPFEGLNYYRLTQYDFDGKYEVFSYKIIECTDIIPIPNKVISIADIRSLIDSAYDVSGQPIGDNYKGVAFVTAKNGITHKVIIGRY